MTVFRGPFPLTFLPGANLRLVNLQLQRQRCRRLERFFKVEENFDSKTRLATRGVGKFLQRWPIVILFRAGAGPGPSPRGPEGLGSEFFAYLEKAQAQFYKISTQAREKPEPAFFKRDLALILFGLP
jgi:hypothetical protein